MRDENRLSSLLGPSSSCLIPLSLALLYSASAQLFQAAWHDVKWLDYERCRSIAGRAALVGAGAASTAFMLPSAGGASSSSLSVVRYGTGLTALSTAASAWLIQRTRQMYVLGPRITLPKDSLKGRVVFVTGSNTGIGFETAKQLYEAGATVIMGCRSEGRARNAMERIRSASSNDTADKVDGTDDKRLIFIPIDVSDLESVRSAAEQFRSLSLPLHTLILNAGIMMSERRESVDGHELTIAANHLGHFLLANLLLPSMRTVDDPRVVVLTSSTYTLASPGIYLDDLQCQRRKYTMFSQYAQSKLANILFVKELARREEQHQRTVAVDGSPDAPKSGEVKAFAAHPGLVRTEVVRNMPWYLYYPDTVFGFAVAAFQKTPEAGAWTTIYCATSDNVLDESGSYYVNSRRESVEDFASDEVAASKLWQLSEELVGLKR